MDNEKIWEIYQMSREEAKDNLYFKKSYPNWIEKKKDIILKNPEKLKRFALFSLFQTYRSCNHMGIDLDTDLADKYSSPTKERLENWEQIFDSKIQSTNEYLHLLGFKNIWINLWFLNPFLSFSRKAYFLILLS